MCTHVCMCVYMHSCAYICAYIYACVCICNGVECIYKCVYVYIDMYVCVNVYLYAFVCIHVCICVYMLVGMCILWGYMDLFLLLIILLTLLFLFCGQNSKHQDAGIRLRSCHLFRLWVKSPTLASCMWYQEGLVPALPFICVAETKAPGLSSGPFCCSVPFDGSLS